MIKYITSWLSSYACFHIINSIDHGVQAILKYIISETTYGALFINLLTSFNIPSEVGGLKLLCALDESTGFEEGGLLHATISE